MHVDNLRCLVIKRDAVAKPGTRLKFLRGREIHVDTDWAIMKKIHAVFEPSSSRGQYLNRRHNGKGRHRRQRAPKVGYLLPLNSLSFDGTREMLGFDGYIPVCFDKAFEFFRPWGRWISDWHCHDYFAIPWTGDGDGTTGGTRRNVAPLHTDPDSFFAGHSPVRRTHAEPGFARFGSERERHLSPIEDFKIARLPIVNILRWQGRLPWSIGPACRGTLNAHTYFTLRRNLNFLNRGHCVTDRLVPERIADMSLVHHMVPLPTCHCLVVVTSQLFIGAKRFARPLGKVVSRRAALHRVKAILADGNVQFVEYRTGFDRIQYELKESVFLFRRQRVVNLLGLLCEALVISQHRFRFSIVLH